MNGISKRKTYIYYEKRVEIKWKITREAYGSGDKMRMDFSDCTLEVSIGAFKTKQEIPEDQAGNKYKNMMLIVAINLK